MVEWYNATVSIKHQSDNQYAVAVNVDNSYKIILQTNTLFSTVEQFNALMKLLKVNIHLNMESVNDKSKIENSGDITKSVLKKSGFKKIRNTWNGSDRYSDLG